MVKQENIFNSNVKKKQPIHKIFYRYLNKILFTSGGNIYIHAFHVNSKN